MESPKTNSKGQSLSTNRGFSLIITVTMMVLLSLIAVGLLSLSATVLRSSQSGESAAQARANARLALNLALGDLQKYAGLDTRVTARADILDGSVAHPYLTGVWESAPLDPNAPPSSRYYSESGKEGKLLTWLASGAPPAAEASNQFVRGNLENEITLWGDGALGDQTSDLGHVKASRLSMPQEGDNGSIAWAVLDEGVKARVNNLLDDRSQDFSSQVAQLGTGSRPAVELIEELAGFRPDAFEKGSSDSEILNKAVTRRNFELSGKQLAGAEDDDVRSLLHDITLSSKGLMTNTAQGGLKTDFSLLASRGISKQIYSHEDGMNIGLEGQEVYGSLFDMESSTRSSSPRWNSLFNFASLHENGILSEDGVPKVQVQSPGDWEAAVARRTRGGIVYDLNPTPPEDLVMMPTIAKVQMIFSMIGRDLYRMPEYGPGGAPSFAGRNPNMHNPQADHFKRTRFSYDLHLLYTPVVVLHNPYSVALEFRNLKVQFHHIPFALKVFRNGAEQSKDFVPFETMFADNDTEGKNKIFGMNLKTNRRNRPGSASFTMLPGEVLLFSPYVDPSLTYQANFSGGRKNWDIYVGDNKTANLDAMPGWRGDGLGFSCDWLAGAFRTDGIAQNGRWNSCYGLAADDEIHAEFAPYSAESSMNKFLVTMSGTPVGSRRAKVVNAIEIDYGSKDNLRQTILGNPEGALRFPEEGTITGRELLDWSGTPIRDMVNVKPMAVVSLQAKTTHGGYDPTGTSQVDGRIAAKPFSFAHGSIGASSANLVSEHPSAHSHEIDIQALTVNEGTTSIIEAQGERGNFVTGHSSYNGSKFGVNYEVPVIPLQSFSTLNGANPGGATAYLPRFATPIGNSWAHPLLSSREIEQRHLGYDMYDHSFLLNSALYDRFYFSGLGSQTGPFGNGRTAEQNLEKFAEGYSAMDPRFSLHHPDNLETGMLEDLLNEDLPHEKIAGWQLMEGAFNINSTSVKAWKAMLASGYSPDAKLNELSPAQKRSAITGLGKTGGQSTRVSRFRLPLSRSLDGGGIDELSYWMGPREYNEDELQLLAENIVEQVKLRGPFLSMGEFVNRQLGRGDLAQKGALQHAIDLSDLNQDLAEQSQAGYEIGSAQVAGHNNANSEASSGSSYQGAPGYLTQADLLGVLGNAASPRSDTFTIRGYGDARDRSGRVLATAICEATVQRYPEWIDSQDTVDKKPGELTSEANQKFGRRFQVTSFRWLRDSEV